MIKPLGRQLLLRELDRPQYSEHGVVYPDNYDDPLLRQMVYKVLETGPDVDRDIHPGDRVVLDQFRLNAKAQAGERQWLVAEDSVALIIPNDQPPTTALPPPHSAVP